MDLHAPIFVAGHRGLVGSAILRRLQADGATRLITRARRELDLTRQADVEAFFADERPAYVFLAAARVGGIRANQNRPADFLLENLQIQTNVIEAARRSGVEKLLFLGSSCVYPKMAPQPIHEDALLSGPLEPTNEPYAVAKIAGLKLVEACRRQYGFRGISLMPTNLYGPGDNFDLETSHVLPALLRRFHEAKRDGRTSVTLWGTGLPRRELLHVDDLADAALLLMREYDSDKIVNVGCGEDVTIRELAEIVAGVVDYQGAIEFDSSKPDGTPRKLLDISRLRALGWKPKIPLEHGIRTLYRWYLSEGPGAEAAIEPVQYRG
ncbi:MAG: GDP-L-fucose synthase [Bryobacterales bacterium]